jgi:pyridoxamine 5'-phosphate oxidase
MTTNKFLLEDFINKNPFLQFNEWYKEHLTSGVSIPEAMSLGTSTTNGKVSVRTVLLKEYSENGFIFFTNYKSKKGLQLSDNPNCSLLFYWSESGRQVRIEGVAEKVSPEYSDSYFKTRPRESQLSAWASEQSSIVTDRHYLEERHSYYSKKFSGCNVERPPHWGGFCIIPSWFEFWQNDFKRLHDRLTFTKVNSNWKMERLAP